jgi:prephenate dehydrogenase
MPIRQITIIGTGLIGGSFALAIRKQRFSGRIIGCDRAPVLERARHIGVIDDGHANPSDAVRGSQVVVLAAPVGAIIDLIKTLGPVLPAKTVLTDVGSTKSEIVLQAGQTFGRAAKNRFLAGHPMAGREHSGVENSHADLFQGAAWLFTPFPGQNLEEGVTGEFVQWVEKIGAKVGRLDPVQHDRFCAWISHLPQMISTALAAALVEEFGPDAPLLDAGGRALREMTRISSSPYSMWRDIALTNKKNIASALLRLEQHLAHIRENLDTRELAVEFERAHHLKKK